MKTLVYALAFSMPVLLSQHAVWAQAGTNKERAALATALDGSKLSLGAGLTATAKLGKPISAKFRVADEESGANSLVGEIKNSLLADQQLADKRGQLELSVRVEKDGKFKEVVVDLQSGKVTRFWPVSGGKDLTAARAQSAALAKTNVSLTTAVDKAVADTGYTAVSVVPTLKNKQPVATITLVKDGKWKTVTEKLK